MKNLAILFFLIIFSLTAFGQNPKSTPKKVNKLTKTVLPKLGTEQEEFDKARALPEAAQRVEALQNFIKNFPESAEILRVQGLIVSARAELGDQKLRAGETEAGIALFKLAVTETPTPISNELFTKVILGFPLNLDSLGQRGAAFDIAKMIEEKVGANAGQILDLSKFYINVQYGTEAIRLAKKAVELAPDSAEAYQILGIATRLNFQLEDAAGAYAKAVELAPDSIVNKLNLAEMKRALGKPDEAIMLYREILAKDSTDINAQTGLTLALFDAGKRAEAEAEMAKSLEAKPENISLLVGAAYWYAARNEGEKAVEYSQKAVAIDPRIVWAYIAQARGLLAQNKPLEAEKILLVAKQYSDFPTLDYELASARLAAGYYRDAAESLKKNFAVNKEGLIETYLGNRILADAKSFTELLSLERRVAIFTQSSADNPENAAKLKALLDFNQRLEAAEINETELARAVDEFTGGGDNMRLHRQLFVATRLLQKKVALPKVLELTQAAIGGVDSALNVASPSAAVLADEIYENRQFAISRNQIIVVPDIPRQTLSAILRGRIEEIAGWTLYNQNNVSQSVIRLKRALSVLPEKSAWWRLSMWHLGAALSADGQEKEALDAYIKGYNADEPDSNKRLIIENLYQKMYGSLDGLDAKIGARPESPTIAAGETKTTETQNTDNVKTTEPTPSPEVKVEVSPTPKAEETPQRILETKTEAKPTPENSPVPTPEIKPEISPSPSPETSPSPTPDESAKTEEKKPAETPTLIIENPPTQPTENTPKTETSPSPTPEETPAKEIQPTVTPTPEPKTEPTPTPEKTPLTEEAKIIEVKTEPTPQTSPTPETVTETKPENNPELKPEPTPSPAPENKEPKSENKYNVVVTENIVAENTSSKSGSKSLFEPIIINVPKPETPQKESVKTAEKTSATVNQQEKEPTDKPKPETKPGETVTDEKIMSGENRLRIIITENTGAKTVTEEITTCKIVVSQEALSLLNGGGSLGVEVGFDGDGDLKQISALSSSPGDVEVVFEPGIGDGSKKVFFIIRTISTKTGVFTVTFEAPCGKKEILVKVR